MAEKIPARFRKTKSDKWAVMAPVEDLEKALAGDGKVDVLKKSGDWTTFRIVALGEALRGGRDPSERGPDLPPDAVLLSGRGRLGLAQNTEEDRRGVARPTAGHNPVDQIGCG